MSFLLFITGFALATRLIVMSLPAFSSYPLAGYASPYLTGTGAEALTVLVLGTVTLMKSHPITRVCALTAATVYAGINLAAVFSMTYFGWILRPEHAHMLTSEASFKSIFTHITNSVHCIAATGALAALIPIAIIAGKSFRKKVSERKLLLSIGVLAGLLFLAGTMSSKEHYKNGEAPKEVVMSPVMAVMTNFFEHHRNNPMLEPPDQKDLKFLSEHFRRGLSEAGAAASSNQFGLLEKMKGSLIKKDGKLPNILLVQVESLRAHEFSAFAPEDQKSQFGHATPFINDLASRSVLFTEVLATGDLTHYGEIATGCSIFAMPFFNAILESPELKMSCLPAHLADRGYVTYFFNGTHGKTNNRHRFYPAHGTRYVYSIENLPPGPTVGWGLTDKSVYSSAVSILKRDTQPFFAHILTLSGHAPFLHAPDANFPDGLYSRKESVLRYADESLRLLVGEIYRKFPDTLLVLTADHGEWPEEGFKKHKISYSDIRKHHRIPLMMYHPDFDSSLHGTRIPTLATDADTAPTILSLLGIVPEVSSFMGENIFAKHESAIIKYGNEWLSIRPEHLNKDYLDDLTWEYDRKLAWSKFASQDLLPTRNLSAISPNTAER